MVALALLLTPWGVAAEPELYAARVAVASRGLDDRNSAVDRAYLQVLAKASGRSLDNLGTAARGLAAKGSQWVQEYRYIGDASGAEDEGLALRVRFDPAAVERDLRELGVPLWRNRPSLLVWTLDVGAQPPALLANDAGGQLEQARERVADQRGLSLLRPLLDLEDRRAADPAALAGADAAAVERASGRYDAELALLLLVADQGRSGRFVLTQRGQTVMEFSVRGADRQAMATAGWQRLADELAQRYAPSGGSGQQQRHLLAVQGLTRFGDYWALLADITGISQVSQVRLRQISGDHLLFEVAADADRLQLQQQLELLAQWQLLPGAADDGTLRFQYR